MYIIRRCLDCHNNIISYSNTITYNHKPTQLIKLSTTYPQNIPPIRTTTTTQAQSYPQYIHYIYTPLHTHTRNKAPRHIHYIIAHHTTTHPYTHQTMSNNSTVAAHKVSISIGIQGSYIIVSHCDTFLLSLYYSCMVAMIYIGLCIRNSADNKTYTSV